MCVCTRGTQCAVRCTKVCKLYHGHSKVICIQKGKSGQWPCTDMQKHPSEHSTCLRHALCTGLKARGTCHGCNDVLEGSKLVRHCHLANTCANTCMCVLTNHPTSPKCYESGSILHVMKRHATVPRTNPPPFPHQDQNRSRPLTGPCACAC